ncbi:MCP four helix bundle domain-containing protein [Piscinibacter sp. Jin2]|uniref:MCP four helix bundle domain-containing protein n=1 Tax=Aquariibacter lacus TaxID=2801332 RepID=A0A9X0XG37_9BURK|nr:methyl-accepting chemotaxis protein [Piscinibacter lacus]MBL0720458.1 MCP four helix bundle domain-containing protein [Piscinibacter lacus]
MLTQLKIGQRLGVGFAGLLLLLLAVLFVSLRQMSGIEHKLEAVSQVTMRTAELLADAGAAIDMRAIAARNLTLEQDPAAQKPEVERIHAAKSKLDASLADLSQLVASDPKATPQDVQMVQDLLALEKRYEPIAAEIVALATAQKQAEAIQQLTKSCMPLLNEILDKLHQFNESSRKEAMAETAAAMSSYQHSQQLMIALGLGAVMLLIGMGWALTRSVTRPLDRVVQATRTIASGDLSQAITIDGKDEVADVQRALADMQANLLKLITEVRNTTDGISTASTQIATGNLDLSSRTEQTASNLQETASSMEQLTGTVKQTADSARTANQLASSAATAAQRGGAVVTQVVSNMEDISASSKKIADIIGVIDGIAFQTNILALNAAVEAARAGEQGRGFAVVAGEVRNLAQRSAQAAKEIKGLIGDSVDKVESGARLVQDAGSTMEEIVSSVRRVSDIIGEITAASAEQSDGIGQVNQAVNNLDQMTQQNAALVEESSAAAESLREQAQRLQQAIGSFRLEQGAQVQAAQLIDRVRSSPRKAPAPASTAAKPAAPRPAAGKPAPRATAAPAARPAAAPRSTAAARPASPPAAAPAGDDDWTSF